MLITFDVVVLNFLLFEFAKIGTADAGGVRVRERRGGRRGKKKQEGGHWGFLSFSCITKVEDERSSDLDSTKGDLVEL